VETTEQLTDFLEGQRDDDGHAALSEAKMRSVGIADRVVSITDDGELVAVGVAATHTQPDETTHWGVETVVIRPMQFPAFEDATLERALGLVPRGAPMSVWSRRRSLDDALQRAGFVCTRSLAHMVVQLPLDATTALTVDGFASGDEDRLLSVNHATFGTHREASGLDESELAQLMSEPWFDPDGVLFHQIDGVDAAFCWTKLHPNGDGEIYRIGVVPRFQGSGLGRQIVIAGYEHLATHHGAERGTLWVDESNRSAMRIYETIGMRVEVRNREFSQEVG
jgi:mycothiol synthase